MSHSQLTTVQVSKILSKEVAPALAMDGLDLEVVGVAEGVVQIRFKGACGNCPSSIMASIMLLEDELRKRLPAVDYLEVVP